MTKEEIIIALREVEHPGNGDRNIVELGMWSIPATETGT